MVKFTEEDMSCMNKMSCLFKELAVKEINDNIKLFITNIALLNLMTDLLNDTKYLDKFNTLITPILDEMRKKL